MRGHRRSCGVIKGHGTARSDGDHLPQPRHDGAATLKDLGAKLLGALVDELLQRRATCRPCRAREGAQRELGGSSEGDRRELGGRSEGARRELGGRSALTPDEPAPLPSFSAAASGT